VNLLALIGLGQTSRGYPMLAYSRRKTQYQLERGLVPKAVVVVDTDAGCQLLTYPQAEFARLYATF
jgi:hypothetical protein